MWHNWNNEKFSPHAFFLLLVFFLRYNISDCVEISLCNGWSITNENNGKIRTAVQVKEKKQFDLFSIGLLEILIRNESLPSGVYSALYNAKLTDSLLKSFNDVNLRWIAREKWTYSLEFNGSGNNLTHIYLVSENVIESDRMLLLNLLQRQKILDIFPQTI